MVLISVHSMVVVLKDQTSFMYTDSELRGMGTCIASEVDDLVADDTAAVSPARGWLVVGVQVQVHSVPRVFFHLLSLLKLYSVISNRIEMYFLFYAFYFSSLNLITSFFLLPFSAFSTSYTLLLPVM